jgi:hypothetical protein
VNDPENDPVLICRELDTTPDGSVTGAKEALNAYEDDTAVVALPLKLPVNPPVDRVEPVTVNPFGNVMYPDAADANDDVTE